MTLYEIDREIESLIDPETGEIADYEQFEQLQMDSDRKIENVGCWIKNLRAEADAITAEAKNQQERAKAAKAKADSLERYLEYALNGEKFSTPRVGISWRKSQAVRIEDEVAFCEQHPNYAKVKTEVKPDKDAIKSDLKKGVQISGAVLEERNNLQIK